MRDNQQPAVITDPATGIQLTPGNPEQCQGNCERLDSSGEPVASCCEECDYILDCIRA